ncbi:MAG: hypothetical protein ACM3PY_01885 [Omnitrophica WOR_2 bacterium]
MSFETLAFPSVLIVTLTSLLLLISRNWRWSILALALQYIGVFLLVAPHWPIEMAVTKIVAGWMAGAVLGIAISEAVVASPDKWSDTDKFSPSGYVFRLLAAGLVGLVVLSSAPNILGWIPGATLPLMWGSLILIGNGLLHLGLSTQPLRVVLGLLTIMSGFEILYSAVETSTLVAGLLAAVNLGLALIGAYLIMAPYVEENE